LFDAGGSFDANNTGIAIAAYSWDFGDGSTSLLTQSVASHFFMRPGTYPVSLIVSTSGSQGVKSTAYIRVVVIVPALGSIILALRDSSGLGLSDPVTIQLFNASISTPSVTKTSQGVVTFDQLSPGQYTLKFSGPTVESYSKLEKVGAGLPTQDTIYLTLIPAPPDYGTILFFASLVIGVSLLSVFIVVRQIRSRSKAKKKRAS
jgi:PKD repeat protein